MTSTRPCMTHISNIRKNPAIIFNWQCERLLGWTCMWPLLSADPKSRDQGSVSRSAEALKSTLSRIFSGGLRFSQTSLISLCSRTTANHWHVLVPNSMGQWDSFTRLYRFGHSPKFCKMGSPSRSYTKIVIETTTRNTSIFGDATSLSML